MNFDYSTSVQAATKTTLDRFEVGNIYQDDAEKLHSDLIGINAISLTAQDSADHVESVAVVDMKAVIEKPDEAVSNAANQVN